MSVEPVKRARWFGVLTIGWTAAWCGEVAAAWQHAPYDRTGLPSALLWIVAAVVGPKRPEPARWMLAGAWLGSMLGVIGELHVACHVALVGAVCAWLRGPALGVVAVAALAWMPALGWVLAPLSPPTVNGLRVVLAAAALGFASVQRLRRERAFA
jgi:hypothetical protein